MSKIIECENITHYYGNRLIYENLSFDVEQGKVLGLLGKNGTGKTTIINILNGYLKPRSGVCRLFGEEIVLTETPRESRIGSAEPQRLPGLAGDLWGPSACVQTDDLALRRVDCFHQKPACSCGLGGNFPTGQTSLGEGELSSRPQPLVASRVLPRLPARR